MSKLNSYEEFENSLRDEEIPQTDLNYKTIMEGILNTKKRKKKIKPQIVLVAVLLMLVVIPIFNDNISYSQILKDIKESFYGKVVKYLDLKDNDGGFQLVEYEESEEEKERNERANGIDTYEIYSEIHEQLEAGEVAILAHVEMYNINQSYYNVTQPIIFNDIEGIKEYGLDIAMPEDIPIGYKFDRATLDFVGKDYDEIDGRIEELIEEAKEKNLPYLWKRLENIKEFSLRVYYEPKGGNPGYSTISVYINLTDHDGANQRLVEKGTDYKVDILSMGEKEVLRFTYGNDDDFNYYIFKIPDRQYKTYEILTAKDNTLPFEELESMIESFK